MAPGDLEQLLEGLPREIADPNLLVGLRAADDAAVYRIAEDRALVFTVDIITPIVDDPRDWGAIAATNAISDVFAMGGKPLVALNVACFAPELPMAIYREVLAGAAEAARAMGCLVVGGHTIKDSELKFGMAVIGEIHPDRILSNATAREGDVLVLTKALGSAALASALKQGRLVSDDPAIQGMVRSLRQSNGPAAEILIAHGCHALTDVTGFGLSGHGLEMAQASQVTLALRADSLPALDGALELLVDRPSCGGAYSNELQARDLMRIEGSLRNDRLRLFHDPQTSGPLLAALPESQAESALRALTAAGYDRSTVIGSVLPRSGAPLQIC